MPEAVEFSSGALRFTGTLHLPDGGGPHPTLIVLHAANGATRDYPFYQHLALRLPPAGIAVFLYDRRGSGGSTGNFETSAFTDLAGDATAALDHLSERNDIDRGRIAVYGISQGGWIAPLVATRRPDVRCVIVVSGCGVSPAEQMEYALCDSLRRSGFSGNDVDHAAALYHRVNDYYRGRLAYRTARQEIEAAQSEPWASHVFPDASALPEDPSQDKWYYELDFDPLPAWREVRQPTLFVFAGRDRWIPVERSITELSGATDLIKDATFERVDGTDHFMGTGDDESDPTVSEAYLGILLDWLGAHL